jgi:C_GCAxxG_C_C family probable redox protein
LESDCIPRIATGFGGGIGKQGEVCGAVSGGVMVIGLLRGRTQSDDRAAKEAAYA